MLKVNPRANLSPLHWPRRQEQIRSVDQQPWPTAVELIKRIPVEAARRVVALPESSG